MRTWLTWLGIGVALLACDGSVARPLHGDEAVEDALLKRSLELPVESEPQAVYLANDVSVRKDGRLTLTLANGSFRVFENSCGAEAQRASCVRYALVVHMRSRNLFIVAKERGQAVSYLLLDGVRGAETAIETAPHPSPDGRHILLFDPKKDSRLVTILRRENGRFVRDWSGHPEEPGNAHASLSFEGWAPDGAARFQKTFWKRAGDPAFTSVWSKVFPTQVQASVELKRAGRTWRYAERSLVTSSEGPLRWNWRKVWLGFENDAPLDGRGEPSGVAEVVFGHRTIMIYFATVESEFVGKIGKDGAITGVDLPSGDSGAALMVGQYREMRWPGTGPQCTMSEIILRDGTSEWDVFPNGSVTILVKQLPDTCVRRVLQNDGE